MHAPLPRDRGRPRLRRYRSRHDLACEDRGRSGRTLCAARRDAAPARQDAGRSRRHEAPSRETEMTRGGAEAQAVAASAQRRAHAGARTGARRRPDGIGDPRLTCKTARTRHTPVWRRLRAALSRPSWRGISRPSRAWSWPISACSTAPPTPAAATRRLRGSRRDQPRTTAPDIGTAPAIPTRRVTTTIVTIAYWDDPTAFRRLVRRRTAPPGPANDEAGPARLLHRNPASVDHALRDAVLVASAGSKAIAVLADGLSDMVREHAYWGGMRDRIPLSQTDAMTRGGTPKADGANGACRGSCRTTICA